MMIKWLTVEMGDGSTWGVPLDVVARHRAERYADEFDGDVERSLAEDTLPLFEQVPFEAKDWAANNMNWSDVERHAKRLLFPGEPDFQEGWVNGRKEIKRLDENGDP